MYFSTDFEFIKDEIQNWYSAQTLNHVASASSLSIRHSPLYLLAAVRRHAIELPSHWVRQRLPYEAYVVQKCK